MTFARPLLKLTLCIALAVGLIGSGIRTAFVRAAEPAKSNAAETTKGQRVYSIGHSFHVFMPKILPQIAESAGITDHLQVGNSPSAVRYVIQHWEVADDKFKSKATLDLGRVRRRRSPRCICPMKGSRTS